MDIYGKIIALILLLFLSGFFSSSETAFFSLSRIRLRKRKFRKDPGFKYVVKLLKTPGTFLTTVIIGNETVNIAISVVAAALVYSLAGDIFSEKALPLCSLVVTVPVLLLFGEIIPKTLAVKFSEQIARVNSYPLFLFSSVTVPIRRMLNGTAKIFIRFFVKDMEKNPVDSANIDEDIFKSMVDIGSREGAIEPGERDLIHRVFQLDDINISYIMTLREKIVALPADCSEEDFSRVIVKEKFSRYPVFEGTIDRCCGFVHAKDLLRLRNSSRKSKDNPIRSILRKPTTVLENRNALSVFLQFQKSKNHIGIVVDSTGRTVGVVTMEDILEELFGEIRDETDMEDRN